MTTASRPASQPKPTRPDRANKRMVAGYLEPDTFREHKALIAKHDTTTDAAVTKAIALLFESHGATVPRSIAQRLKTLRL